MLQRPLSLCGSSALPSNVNSATRYCTLLLAMSDAHLTPLGVQRRVHDVFRRGIRGHILQGRLARVWGSAKAGALLSLESSTSSTSPMSPCGSVSLGLRALEEGCKNTKRAEDCDPPPAAAGLRRNCQPDPTPFRSFDSALWKIQLLPARDKSGAVVG